MLFDEKKMPYHLMLQKFLLSGGQNAFFDAFYWALSIGKALLFILINVNDPNLNGPWFSSITGYKIPPEDGLDADLPEFTGEFLDSWLVLLEKMVNPKTVLESPHTLPKTASKATGGNYKPFDPLKYLTRTHRLAFEAVMKIWGKKPLKTYGARMSESVLTILCHILKGEKLIAAEREKAQSEQAKMNGPSSLVSLTGGNPIPVLGGIGSSLAASLNELPRPTNRAVSSLLNEAAAAVSAAPQEPPEVNQEHVATLMDMGFPRERCIEALQVCQLSL